MRSVPYSLGDAMDSSVPHRIPPELPTRPPVTAGTHEAEGVAVEAVAADAAVSDPGSAPSDRDRVEHGSKLAGHREAGANGEGRPDASLSSTAPPETSTPATGGNELDRLARLRRWQAVGERRT